MRLVGIVMRKNAALLKIGLVVCLCAIILVAIIPYVSCYIRTKKFSNVDTLYDYPYYSLSNLVDESSYIVEAKVAKVKERVTHKITVRYRDENGKRRKSSDYMNVTPIKLEVKQVIKGKVRTKSLTCYKEFSLTENQNALPSGPTIKEGMEFVLFLDKNKHWLAGGQGLSLVFGDKVSSEKLYEHLEDPESVFELIDVDQVDSTIWDVRGKRELSVADKDYYISVIRSLMNRFK